MAKFFKMIGNTFNGVRLELKKVIWPTKEKLKQTSVVCLAIILFFAIFFTVIGTASKWGLEKIGFYDVPTTTETTAAEVAVPETTVAESAEETTAAETVAETSADA